MSLDNINNVSLKQFITYVLDSEYVKICGENNVSSGEIPSTSVFLQGLQMDKKEHKSLYESSSPDGLISSDEYTDYYLKLLDEKYVNWKNIKNITLNEDSNDKSLISLVTKIIDFIARQNVTIDTSKMPSDAKISFENWQNMKPAYEGIDMSPVKVEKGKALK